MAARKKAGATTAHAPGGPEAGQPEPKFGPGRLTRIKLWNLWSIDERGVDIPLDDIVVLVGENNTGKSSIVRAYALALNAEEKSGVLSAEDFHRRRIPSDRADEAHLRPRIEIETRITGDPPDNGLWRIDGAHAFLRERFTWTAPGLGAVRETYRAGFAVLDDEERWSKEEQPYGAAGVRKGKRPKVYEVDAFAQPNDRAEEVANLLREPLDRLQEEILAGAGDESIKQIEEAVRKLRSGIREKTDEQLKATSDSLSAEIGRVLPGYRIELDPPADGAELDGLALFPRDLAPRMGAGGDFMSTLDRQGAGAQRTLLWAVLRYLASLEKKVAVERGRVLLLDEPELCLHPTAIRAACETLYSLAEGNHGWQVMITTHSPLFIDLNRDHTTVVRLSREGGRVGAVGLFRSELAGFDATQKQQLKLLNVYEPHVAEFFFGGRTVLVEGDTEYSAFRRVAAERPDLRDVNIVRARGKYLLVLLIKILNQFGACFAVLHDFDRPTVRSGKHRGKANSAWAANEAIRAECEAAAGRVTLVGAVENFEQALFGEDARDDKPYEAVRTLAADASAFAAVELLLRVLAGRRPAKELPAGFIAYQKLAELAEIRAMIEKRGEEEAKSGD